MIVIMYNIYVAFDVYTTTVNQKRILLSHALGGLKMDVYNLKRVNKFLLDFVFSKRKFKTNKSQEFYLMSSHFEGILFYKTVTFESFTVTVAIKKDSFRLIFLCASFSVSV